MQVMDEFKDSGAQHAIWLALAAAVRAHPDPRRAVREALSAVEFERSKQIHSTQEWSTWGDGFAEAQESLIRHLGAIADEQPKT